MQSVDETNSCIKIKQTDFGRRPRRQRMRYVSSFEDW